jgi:methyl-accepting chemotaxis protein
MIEGGIGTTAWLMSVLGTLAVLLAALGVYIIRRAVAQPLGRITRITEAIAAGDSHGTVPFRSRGDEVGALARSIAVFQETVRRNAELDRTVVAEAQARARRHRGWPLRSRGRGHAVGARRHLG